MWIVCLDFQKLQLFNPQIINHNCSGQQFEIYLFIIFQIN